VKDAAGLINQTRRDALMYPVKLAAESGNNSNIFLNNAA
jgi:hypothetical protein